jgi:glucan phosphoethanolaminetransferase (alkaline phosphatase superfamily)
VPDNTSNEYLQVLENAYQFNDFQCYLLDITLILVITAIKLYRILLTRRKKPFQRRSRSQKLVHRVSNFIRNLLLIVFLVIFFLSSVAIFHFTTSLINSLSPSPYPTSIPWINNQVECERTYRSWQNGECWDGQHNPMF